MEAFGCGGRHRPCLPTPRSRERIPCPHLVGDRARGGSRRGSRLGRSRCDALQSRDHRASQWKPGELRFVGINSRNSVTNSAGTEGDSDTSNPSILPNGFFESGITGNWRWGLAFDTPFGQQTTLAGRQFSGLRRTHRRTCADAQQDQAVQGNADGRRELWNDNRDRRRRRLLPRRRSEIR